MNDASIKWATYNVQPYAAAAFASQAAARDRVRYERRLELAMEGQRFFDLRRWKIADQVLNAYIGIGSGSAGVGGGNEKSRRAQLASANAWVGATDSHY